MKKIILISIYIGILGISVAWADYIFVSGDVSGTWSVDTVFVDSTVRIPPDQTLTIEPGVEVLFWVHCKFIVDIGATLYAVGTESNVILFDEYFPGNGWHGIRFINAAESSRLEYCHLTHGLAPGYEEDAHGGAIYCSNSDPIITNCLIDSCRAGIHGEGTGGAIYCADNSNAIIINNFIRGNSACDGGGICCNDSSNLIISGNTISGNSVSSPYTSGGRGGGIFCNNGSNSSISGNTITGNSACDGGWGGAIYCNYSSPIISHNTISSNTSSDYYGGGICCYFSSSTIDSNTISGNSASWNGGGIAVYNSDSSLTIRGNIITGNSAAGSGGGIYCRIGSYPTIEGNTICGNWAHTYGGGIYIEPGSPKIIRNYISQDSARSGGGIYCGYFFQTGDPIFELNEISLNTASDYGGGIFLESTNPLMNKNTIVYNGANAGGGLYLTDSSPVLVNCILWGNDSQQITQISGSDAQVTYSDIQGIWPGATNIHVNPLFVNVPLGNYHLQSNSPCIDTGDPNPIYNDPDGTRADMGCYYFDQGGVPPFPFITLSSDVLDFGLVPVGNQSVLPITIYSIGDTVAVINDVFTTDTSFYSDFVPADSLVPAGDSLVFTVTFEPAIEKIYDEMLFVISNGYNDTLTVSLLGDGGAVPDTVRNLVITMEYPDAILTWDEVTTSLTGYPLEVDYYLIYFVENLAYPFNFLTYTSNTTYTHYGVMQFSPSMFYFIEAYIGEIGGLDELLASGRSMTREEVHAYLNSDNRNISFNNEFR